MHSSYDGKYCDKCKKGFYINRNDDSCYSNKEPGDFYKCGISNGETCIECIDGFYLGYSGNLVDCKVFKYRTDSTGKMIVPDLETEAKSVLWTLTVN